MRAWIRHDRPLQRLSDDDIGAGGSGANASLYVANLDDDVAPAWWARSTATSFTPHENEITGTFASQRSSRRSR